MIRRMKHIFCGVKDPFQRVDPWPGARPPGPRGIGPPALGQRMDRVRGDTTRCARCSYYVCACQTGADDVALRDALVGNHVDAFSRRRRLQVADFAVDGSPSRTERHTCFSLHVVRLRASKTRKFLLKSVDRGRARALGQEKHARGEREVLSELSERSPHCVSLLGHFEDPKSWHLLLEHVAGGRLDRLVAERGMVAVEDFKLYAAQMWKAVRFLRDFDVAHRNITSENWLISQAGHLKLTGFTFARKLRSAERAFTLVGTPNYMAPEVVAEVETEAGSETGTGTETEAKAEADVRGGGGGRGEEGYTRSVDWYSVGAVLFEALQGAAPYAHMGAAGILAEKGSRALTGPPKTRLCVDSRAWDVVSRLMGADAAEREQFASNKLAHHDLFKFHNRERFDWAAYDKVGTFPVPDYVPPSD